MTKDGASASGRSLSLDWSRWRATLLRREIVAICLFVFTADMILGSIRPTLSLFAESLGGSLTLVGVMALVLGITQLSSSVITGRISDHRGRRGVLMAGMVCFALAALFYSLATAAYLLLPIQVLLALGFVATLSVALAYATDVVTIQERSLVIGLVTTVMGLGYATGAATGGTVADLWGYTSVYRLAAGLALIGFAIAWRGIPGERRESSLSSRNESRLYRQVGTMLASPMVLAACLGSLLINLTFGGLIVIFFPIYAHSLGISTVLIGSMFATRALASTAMRLPAGALAMIIPAHYMMLVALLVALTVAFMLPQVTQPGLLTLLLLAEGIAYGLFMTSGQATVTGYAAESSRGAALGLYSAAAAIGDSVMPLILGIVADHLGVSIVFYVAGGLTAIGLTAIVRILTRRAPGEVS